MSKYRNLPFHNRADIDATISFLAGLTNDTDTKKVDLVWRRERDCLKCHFNKTLLILQDRKFSIESDLGGKILTRKRNDKYTYQLITPQAAGTLSWSNLLQSNFMRNWLINTVIRCSVLHNIHGSARTKSNSVPLVVHGW